MTNPVNHNNFELLYIYISKIDRCYENISFKFTNKYEILYNKKYRELTIKQNQNDYLENFFGDKISSINLIVGENGSGKTTLLDLIGLMRDNRSDYFKKMDYDENGGWFALYKIEENQFYIEGENHNLIKNIDLPNNEKINWVYSLYFEYNYINNNMKGRLYNSHIHKDIPFIFYRKNKTAHSFINNNYVSFNPYSPKHSYLIKREYINDSKYSDLYKISTLSPEFNSVFENIPLNISMNFTEKYEFKFQKDFKEIIEILSKEETYNSLTPKDKITIRIYLNEIIGIYYNHTTEDEIINESPIKDLLEQKEYFENIKKICNKSINIIDTIKQIFKLTCETLDITVNHKIGSDYFNNLQEFIKHIREIPEKYMKTPSSPIEKLSSEHFKTNPLNRQPFQIIFPFDRYHEKFYNLLEFYDNKSIFYEYEGLLRKDYKECINIVSDNNISEGELNYITSFCGLFNAMNSVSMNQNSCILILDEPEQGFHPKWITSYIDTIVKIAKKIDNNCKYQIIISTHSPFMISDVPKEWINCIKTEKNKKTIINPKQSFACNYYDIIKDNFFLENSMGDFAISKLREFHNVLKPENKKEEDGKTSLIYKTKEDVCKQLNIDDTSNIENVITNFIDSIGEVLIKIQLEHLWENIKKEWSKNKAIPNNDTERQKELYNIFNKLDKQQQDEIIKKIKDEYHAEN